MLTSGAQNQTNGSMTPPSPCYPQFCLFLLCHELGIRYNQTRKCRYVWFMIEILEYSWVKDDGELGDKDGDNA